MGNGAKQGGETGQEGVSLTSVTSEEGREERSDRVNQNQVEVGMEPVSLVGNLF